jgi:ankyrin repeat protein
MHDENGLTPLMSAARIMGNGDVIRLLLEQGADTILRDRQGHDVFYYAGTNQEYVKLLHDYAARRKQAIAASDLPEPKKDIADIVSSYLD